MDRSPFERLDDSISQLKRRLKNIKTIQDLAGSRYWAGEFDYDIVDVEFSGPILKQLEKLKLQELFDAFNDFLHQLDQLKKKPNSDARSKLFEE